MSTDLPEDPNEREILLRALRDYSENCAPPRLTARCPFSIDTEPGVRACREECMDLLGRYDAPRPSEEVDVGEGITVRRARRPRSRRPPNPSAKAFDAREIYLDDRGRGDPSRWRLAAVLHGLVEAVQTRPPADAADASAHRTHIAELIQVAEGRGLSFETHVLPQLRLAVSGAVFGHVVTASRRASALVDSNETDEWLELARDHLDPLDPNPSVESLGKAFEAVLNPIIVWALTADLDDLIDWKAPARPLLDIAPPELVVDTDEDGQWIVDRFTKTYLEEWSDASLRKEWLYLHGQHEAPCLPLEMAVRQVQASELSPVMADRFVAGKVRQRPQLARRLVEPAIHFLKDGRRVEAAALFEAAVRREPDSCDALNNLGFCLLPDDPGRSIEYLNRASATGRGDVELIDTNRILALAAAGRLTSALDLAATHCQRYANSGSRAIAWLWDIDTVLTKGEPALVECRDLAAYVEQIREAIERLMAEPTNRQRNES